MEERHPIEWSINQVVLSGLSLIIKQLLFGEITLFYRIHRLICSV